MGAFTDSLTRNIDRVKKEIDDKLYSIFFELGARVIANTPVLRGNLINDFWPASNSYNTTVQTKVVYNDQFPDGQSSIQPHSDVTGSGSLSRLADVKNDGTFYGKDGFLSFSTSVPYAYRIEYEGYSERKAPSGFMRISLAQIAAKYT